MTSCCTQWQAVGVWFRIASQSKHFRPPSRPANGTSNTLSVQGRVLVISKNSFPKLGTLQVTSHQLGHFQSYVSSFQSWFRIASQSKHFRPPSRPANGTSNTLSVQGRVLVISKNSFPKLGTLQVTSHQLGHFQSYVSSFQSSIAEYLPETVTSCCTQ